MKLLSPSNIGLGHGRPVVISEIVGLWAGTPVGHSALHTSVSLYHLMIAIGECKMASHIIITNLTFSLNDIF